MLGCLTIWVDFLWKVPDNRFMRYCSVCRTQISDARIAALPETRVCVNCSDETPVKGFMTWEHKTAPKFQIVTPRQHAWFQQYDRKRPAASLPMSSRTPTIGMPVLERTAPLRSLSASPVDASAPLSLVPFARCGHNDRPQVSSSGKCLECALRYYALRAQHAGWQTASK